MMTKKQFIRQLDTLDEVIRYDSIEMKRHEEFYNGAVAAIIAAKRIIENSDLEEGEE